MSWFFHQRVFFQSSLEHPWLKTIGLLGICHELGQACVCVRVAQPTQSIDEADSLDRHLLAPRWHYHPTDIASVNIGYLAAQRRLPPPPWTSDTLSAAVGVESSAFARHTALGDARWVLAQWDATTRLGRAELPTQARIDAIALHAIAERLEHQQQG